MVISQIGMYDLLHDTSNKYKYFIFISLLIVYIYLYRNQIYINDLGYLRDIKEYNSHNIFTSSIIKNKTKSNKIKRFSNYVITNMNKEISFIDNFIV
jgi:hypothetical protein